MGQGARLAAGAVDVQQGVDDLTPLVLGGAAARLGGPDESLDLGPLAVGQVAGVVASSVHARSPMQLQCRLSQHALSSTLADSDYHSGVARSSSEQACRTERFTGFLASASRRRVHFRQREPGH